jgi:hypothetical protein
MMSWAVFSRDVAVTACQYHDATVGIAELTFPVICLVVHIFVRGARHLGLPGSGGHAHSRMQLQEEFGSRQDAAEGSIRRRMELPSRGLGLSNLSQSFNCRRLKSPI